MTKVVSITSKSKGETYEEVLKYHLEQLSDEQKNVECYAMFLVSTTEIGMLYSVVKEEGVENLIGLIEVAKQHMLLSTLLE